MTFHTIAYDTMTIEYELIFSQRKTLGITVHPDGRVVVRAPRGASSKEVEKVVHKKAGWISKKQQEFEQYPPPPPPRQYVSGESHLYLGRSYRLKVVEDKREKIELQDGRLHLHVRDQNDRERKQKLLENWYRRQAKIIFPERLAALHPHAAPFGIPFPPMKIRKMKSRWGSCSSKGSINLNLRLIQTSTPCIDYVIMHELAHLKEHNHGRNYYALLDRLMPDWNKRRDELHQFPVV